MHRLIALYNDPTDREHFRRHLLDVHLPIVSRFLGLQAMRVGFVSPSGEDRDSPYFGVVECDFENKAAMQEALASPAGQESAADVPNYAGAGVLILTFDMENFDR